MTSNLGFTQVIFTASPVSIFRYELVLSLLLRQREREQRAPLAGAEHAGQEALGPGAPAGRHGDELPAVHLVGARARVVTAAALELPQQVARLRVERVELTGGLAPEDEVAGRRQQRRAHRDV